jgi:hypothetical protein
MLHFFLTTVQIYILNYKIFNETDMTKNRAVSKFSPVQVQSLKLRRSKAGRSKFSRIKSGRFEVSVARSSVESNYTIEYSVSVTLEICKIFKCNELPSGQGLQPNIQSLSFYIALSTKCSGNK